MSTSSKNNNSFDLEMFFKIKTNDYTPKNQIPTQYRLQPTKGFLLQLVLLGWPK
jgi:hypothetical protein